MMKNIIRYNIIVLLSLIQLNTFCQVQFEILTRNILLKKFAKIVVLDVKITFNETNNSDTIILFHNEADRMHYSSKVEDNFFQLYTDTISPRWWSISYVHTYPEIEKKQINCLPQTKKILVVSDTPVICRLKFNTEMLHRRLGGPNYKNGFDCYLSYGSNNYQDYLKSINKTKRNNIVYYAGNLIFSKNTVNIKLAYERKSFFQFWLRDKILPPYFKKDKPNPR